ncbi:MAG: AAA family ATPase [Pseudomonadales bacterium]
MPNITELMETLAGCSQRGHDILEAYRNVSEENASERRFKGEEMRVLAGVSSTSVIYNAEKEGRLPPPEKNPKTGHRLGVTLEQMNFMQDLFKTRPIRKPGEDPVVLSFTNYKGGCWKTTTGWYAGSYIANFGARVLLVDLDPQASLTLAVGILPDVETSHETSLGPYILNELTTVPVSGIIQETYCPNMDIIPSTLQLAGVEYALSNAIVMARENKVQATETMKYWFYRVRETLQEVKQNYDVVIVDGTPSVGLLPINIIFGADSVIVPVPTELTDFASTVSFCDLFYDQLDTIKGVFGDQSESVPDIFFLPTRFAPGEDNATIGSEYVLEDIRNTFLGKTFSTVIKKHDAVVSNLSTRRRTVFDVNAGDLGINRKARKKAIANYTAVFEETLNRAVFPHWTSKKELLENRGVY